MSRRAGLDASAVGTVVAGTVLLLAGLATEAASGRAQRAAAPLVRVTAGRPSEFAFTVSPSAGIPLGRITFAVANRGALPHRFEICAAAGADARRNSCSGTSTRLLAPGQSATLTVTFGVPGTHEYLSSVPGQAARGMKGLIAIGLPVPRHTTTAATATTATQSVSVPTPTAPATTPATTGAASGDAAAGAAVWAQNGCNTCHAVAEAAAAAGGNVSPNLNATHDGGPFPGGPLSPAQIAEIAAYVKAAG